MSRWFCFDVGEVLIDETRVWTTWAVHLGLSPLTFMAALGAELAAGGSHQRLLARFGVTDVATADDLVEHTLGGLQARDLYPDALDALHALRRSGFRVAVAGNQPAQRTEQLRAAGVDAEVLVTSAELGVEKPSGAFFDALLDVLGHPDRADVAYVGDRLDNDVRPAAEAGLRPVWLRRGPWGLLSEPRPDEPARLVVSSLTELVARADEVFDDG